MNPAPSSARTVGQGGGLFHKIGFSLKTSAFTTHLLKIYLRSNQTLPEIMFETEIYVMEQSSGGEKKDRKGGWVGGQQAAGGEGGQLLPPPPPPPPSCSPPPLPPRIRCSHLLEFGTQNSKVLGDLSLSLSPPTLHVPPKPNSPLRMTIYAMKICPRPHFQGHPWERPKVSL